MLVSGVLGAVSVNPFKILQSGFLAIIGGVVISAELRWSAVMNHVGFLKNYFFKGMFFLYLSIPLLDIGWKQYKGCIFFWDKNPCPTPASPDDPVPEVRTGFGCF